MVEAGLAQSVAENHHDQNLPYSQSILLRTTATARNTIAATMGLAKTFLENLVAKIIFSSALVSMLFFSVWDESLFLIGKAAHD